MLEQIPPPDYYPTGWEFLILLIDVVLLIAVGHAFKKSWLRSNDSLPVWAAVLLWLGMFVLYLLLAATFYNATADPIHRVTILAWCFVFWIIPVAYYTHMLVNALAVRSVDRVGPFSARIEDPSEFAAARKLALRGDIDGAVSMYRTYSDNQANALFEAARLLKSEDRFLEAALLFEEIADRFDGINRIWAEATYQLAKLKEVNLREPRSAMGLYRSIMERAPETRFYQLAGNDLSRLRVVEGGAGEEQTGAESLPPDPFYRQKEQAGPAGTPAPAETPAPEESPEEVYPVPPEDPFFGSVPKEQAAAKGAQAAAESAAAKKSAPKKRTAKKKPAAKKKAGAKKKSGARKTSPAKKKPAAKKKRTAKKKPAAKKKAAPKKKSSASKKSASRKKKST